MTDVLAQNPFGAEPPTRMATLTGLFYPSDWNRGGLLLSGDGGVSELRLGGSTGIDSLEVRTLFEEARVVRPRLDPTGEWLAYQATEGRGYGLYVRRAPDFLTRLRVVESDRFISPWWSPEGDSIYTENVGDGHLYVVPVRRGEGVSFGTPRRLFPSLSWYAPLPDGRGFVGTQEAEREDGEGVPERHFLVVGWFDELRRRTGG